MAQRKYADADEDLDAVMEMFGDKHDIAKARERAKHDPKGDPDLFTGPIIFKTLDEAREFVFAHLDDGVQCPCCDQMAVRQNRPLYGTQVAALLVCIRIHQETGDWVDVKDINRRLAPHYEGKSVNPTSDFAKLRHWGLIEQKPKDPNDKTRRTTGMWKPTALAVEFGSGRVRLPRSYTTYNKQIESWDDEQINVVEALGEKFDYSKLSVR